SPRPPWMFHVITRTRRLSGTLPAPDAGLFPGSVLALMSFMAVQRTDTAIVVPARRFSSSGSEYGVEALSLLYRQENCFIGKLQNHQIRRTTLLAFSELRNCRSGNSACRLSALLDALTIFVVRSGRLRHRGFARPSGPRCCLHHPQLSLPDRLRLAGAPLCRAPARV